MVSSPDESLDQPKKTEEGEKVEWLKIRWLRYSKEKPGFIGFKYSLKEEDPFLFVDMGRNRRQQLTEADLVPPMLHFGKPISKEKLKDLKSLYDLLPLDVQTFFNTLTDEDMPDVHPLDIDEEEDPVP